MGKYTPRSLGTFGERLKKARTAQNMTAKDFAKKIGISYPAYINYENDKRVPSGDIVLAMARGLHTSTDYLLAGFRSDVDYTGDVEGTEEFLGASASHIIFYKSSEINSSDLVPFVNEIKERLARDDNAMYKGKLLDNNTRRTLFMDLSQFESDATFGAKNSRIANDDDEKEQK